MLTTDRTRIAPVTADDAALLHRFHMANHDHLHRWEPSRPDGYHSHSSWTVRAATWQADHAADQSYHFAIRYPGADPIIGLCNFNSVQRGAFQACSLGYSIDRKAQGIGLMHEALAALIPDIFSGHGLHRVMASYMPRNQRSGALLARLGFEREGLARDYLKINGVWEDHILTARIAP